jgi:DegV family protein with EDD domain
MATPEKITTISGKLYYKVFLAGANKILENQGLLNKINVFPVPDADTGTNLASTLRFIIDKAQPHESFTVTSNAIATAALNGARGNSGIIFAQFLYGVSIEAGNRESLSIESFAEIMKKSVRYIYDAIAEPVEGTMLTVIREWAEYIYQHKNAIDDFLKLFLNAYEIASRALKETTEKLKVLKLANVVDAGAKGFVLFLEGVIEGFKKTSTAREIIVNQSKIETNFVSTLQHEDFNFRYCSETLIKGQNLDLKELKESIKSMGDSLVVAGSGTLARVHIHTDNPHLLFEKLRDFGTLSYQKVDDMVKQNEAATERKWNIALVTDSTSDLPQELIDKYQVYVVPLNIHFGENQYLDKLTLKPDQFFKLVDSEKDFPSTSQPNELNFINLYSHLATHYDSIISIHISKKFSGTWQNSSRAAQKVSKESGKEISVLDSMHVSGSLGLLTLKIAMAIEEGMKHDEIVNSFPEWRNNTKIFVSVKNLKYMIKGGRVSASRGFIARLMNVKPIVSMDHEGGSTLFDKAFSQRSNMKKVMNHTRKFLADRTTWNYIVLHAEGESAAEWFTAQLTELTGKKPVSISSISPVIGLSAGKGTAAIALIAN